MCRVHISSHNFTSCIQVLTDLHQMQGGQVASNSIVHVQVNRILSEADLKCDFQAGHVLLIQPVSCTSEVSIVLCCR